MVMLTLTSLSLAAMRASRSAARGEVALAGDPEAAMSRMLVEDLDHLTRDAVAAFGRLIGIGRCTDGDGVSHGDAPEFRGEGRAVPLFGENVCFEVVALAQFHELVRVAGVTIFAAVLAAAIGVEGPLEGEFGVAAASDVTAHGQAAVFDFAFGQ
jgi:hypothetical protein